MTATDKTAQPNVPRRRRRSRPRPNPLRGTNTSKQVLGRRRRPYSPCGRASCLAINTCDGRFRRLFARTPVCGGRDGVSSLLPDAAPPDQSCDTAKPADESGRRRDDGSVHRRAAGGGSRGRGCSAARESGSIIGALDRRPRAGAIARRGRRGGRQVPSGDSPAGMAAPRRRCHHCRRAQSSHGGRLERVRRAGCAAGQGALVGAWELRWLGSRFRAFGHD